MFDVEAKPLIEPLPEPVTPARTEEVLIRLDADFTDEGAFGHRILEVTREVVRILEPNGAISFQIPIAEIKSARNEPLIGGGRLEITTKTGSRTLAGQLRFEF